jgi:hypothetical protein
MISTLRSVLVAFSCVAVIACGDTVINVPTTPTPIPDTTKAPPVVKTVIQFRVLGNATSVRVRYSTPDDGVTQVVTSLPYFVTRTITGDSLFLSLEGTPISYGFSVLYPFLTVQIVVNNTVFREASSQDFMLTPLAVSGQWRQ